MKINATPLVGQFVSGRDLVMLRFDARLRQCDSQHDLLAAMRTLLNYAIIQMLCRCIGTLITSLNEDPPPRLLVEDLMSL